MLRRFPSIYKAIEFLLSFLKNKNPHKMLSLFNSINYLKSNQFFIRSVCINYFLAAPWFDSKYGCMESHFSTNPFRKYCWQSIVCIVYASIQTISILVKQRNYVQILAKLNFSNFERHTWSNRVCFFSRWKCAFKKCCHIEWFIIYYWMDTLVYFLYIYIFPSRNVKSLNLRNFASHHIYAEFCWWTESKITNTSTFISVSISTRFLCSHTNTATYEHEHFYGRWF